MRIVISQGMPPMPGGPPPMDPMMGGMPPPGMDPMMGGMPPPGPPPGPPPITKPLENVGELLMDIDYQKLIASNPNLSDGELALKIWEEYGGTPSGEVNSQNTGKRTDDPNQDPAMQEQEAAETEQKRWERLPMGKTIADIVNIGELEGMMSSLKYSVIKKLAMPPAPPGGAPPGGMPGMATFRTEMLRLAAELDDLEPDIAQAIRELS